MTTTYVAPPRVNPLEVISVEADHPASPKGDARPYVSFTITVAVGDAKVDGNRCTATLKQRDLIKLFTQYLEHDGVMPLWKIAHKALVRRFGNRRLKLVSK